MTFVRSWSLLNTGSTPGPESPPRPEFLHDPQQRKRRAELSREMVHAKIRAVRAKRLGGDGQLDRLQERIGRRPHLRVGRIRPVAERQESYALHGEHA